MRQHRAGWLLWRGDDLAELRRALPTLQASGSLGGDERAFATACIAGVRLRRERKKAAQAKQQLREAQALAEHVVFKVNERLAKIPGTAEIRKDLIADAMQTLDKLRSEGIGTDALALLRLRSLGHRQRGAVALTHDNLSMAAREFEGALAIDEERLRRQPTDAQAQSDLSVSLGRAADIARAENRLADAEGWLRRSLAADEQLLRINPLALDTQRDLVIDPMQLSALLHQRGQRFAGQQEAKAAAALLATLCERLPKPDADGLDGAIRSLLR